MLSCALSSKKETLVLTELYYFRVVASMLEHSSEHSLAIHEKTLVGLRKLERGGEDAPNLL